MSKFSRRLRAYRKERKLTLQKLGDELGVTPAAIWKWETGMRRPDRLHLARLSEITGVAPLEILGVAE